jgi:hypothetical protein
MLASIPAHFRPSLLVMSLRSLAGSILFLMGLDDVLFEFLLRAAIGAASVLLLIAFVGVRLPKRAAVPRRHLRG